MQKPVLLRTIPTWLLARPRIKSLRTQPCQACRSCEASLGTNFTSKTEINGPASSSSSGVSGDPEMIYTFSLGFRAPEFRGNLLQRSSGSCLMRGDICADATVLRHRLRCGKPPEAARKQRAGLVDRFAETLCEWPGRGLYKQVMKKVPRP